MSRQAKLTRRRVVDAALEMADEIGWDALAMSDLAARLNVSPSDLLDLVSDKNAVADVWFGDALAAMLQPLPKGMENAPDRVRLEVVLLRWFGALAPYRRVTGQMLQAKMWPAHPHHWVPMIFDLSALVQWWRDVAGLRAGGRRRQFEEVALTAIFLATLAVWLKDETDNQERTTTLLARRLRWMGSG